MHSNWRIDKQHPIFCFSQNSCLYEFSTWVWAAVVSTVLEQQGSGLLCQVLLLSVDSFCKVLLFLACGFPHRRKTWTVGRLKTLKWPPCVPWWPIEDVLPICMVNAFSVFYFSSPPPSSTFSTQLAISTRVPPYFFLFLPVKGEFNLDTVAHLGRPWNSVKHLERILILTEAIYIDWMNAWKGCVISHKPDEKQVKIVHITVHSCDMTLCHCLLHHRLPPFNCFFAKRMIHPCYFCLTICSSWAVVTLKSTRWRTCSNTKFREVALGATHLPLHPWSEE